jgi:hypothetical protein
VHESSRSNCFFLPVKHLADVRTGVSSHELGGQLVVAQQKLIKAKSLVEEMQKLENVNLESALHVEMLIVRCSRLLCIIVEVTGWSNDNDVLCLPTRCSSVQWVTEVSKREFYSIIIQRICIFGSVPHHTSLKSPQADHVGPRAGYAVSKGYRWSDCCGSKAL